VLEDVGGDVPVVETWHVDPTMVVYARDLQSRFPYDPDAVQGIPAVIRQRRSEFVPVIDAQMLDALDLTDELRHVVDELGLSSSIAVPLIKGRRVLGALHLVTAHGSRSYRDDDVALAEALASRIAATIDNVRLREQARTTSAILQRSLLPAALPTLPDVELAMRYWPAGEGVVVGGDFYDVFATDQPGHWAIMIGDVCGTGPQAASLTGLARHTARDAAWHGDTPCEVLLSVHRALQRSGSGTFLTAIYGDLDLTHGEARLTIAVGGHPLPLLVRAGDVIPIGETGTLLGLLDDPHLRSTTHALLPGDLLVLYTDGATDMRPPLAISPGEFEGLVAACAADAGHAAVALADRLGDSFNAIHPFDQRNDDVAAMVLRLGTTAPARRR
jgi:serine phosphatase RsbU (regulator of sigma subunit)